MAGMESPTTTLPTTTEGTPLPPIQAPTQTVGVDTVIIGILGVCGIGVFIALGVFICRSWMSRPSFRQIDSAIYKPCTQEVKRKRHLDLYNTVRLSTHSVQPTVTKEHRIPEYYYSDIMHTDDATIIRMQTNDNHEVDANNNYYENSAPATLPTNEELCSTNELAIEGHCRPE